MIATVLLSRELRYQNDSFLHYGYVLVAPHASTRYAFLPALHACQDGPLMPGVTHARYMQDLRDIAWTERASLTRILCARNSEAVS